MRAPPLASRLPVLLLVACAACASVRAGQTHDPGVDFAAYRTFALAPPPARAENLPGYSELTGMRIQARIAARLEEKGLVRAPEQDADLVVAFSVDGQPRSDVTGTSWSGFGSGDVYTVNYVEGTLVIDLVDRRRQKLVWHGWGTTDIFESDVSGDEVDRAVDAVLAQYPPASRP